MPGASAEELISVPQNLRGTTQEAFAQLSSFLRCPRI